MRGLSPWKRSLDIVRLRWKTLAITQLISKGRVGIEAFDHLRQLGHGSRVHFNHRPPAVSRDAGWWAEELKKESPWRDPLNPGVARNDDRQATDFYFLLTHRERSSR